MRGKERIFEELFEKHYEAMFRLAFTFLHDSEESKDIVSEVFAQLWKKGSMISPDTQKAFLLTCVRNRCINRIARKSRDDKLRQQYIIEQARNIVEDEEEEQRLKALLHAIEHDLPPQAARILRLCYSENKSYREAAEILDISISTVNKHMVNALKILRTKFAKQQP